MAARGSSGARGNPADHRQRPAGCRRARRGRFRRSRAGTRSRRWKGSHQRSEGLPETAGVFGGSSWSSLVPDEAAGGDLTTTCPIGGGSCSVATPRAVPLDTDGSHAGSSIRSVPNASTPPWAHGSPLPLRTSPTPSACHLASLRSRPGAVAAPTSDRDRSPAMCRAWTRPVSISRDGQSTSAMSVASRPRRARGGGCLPRTGLRAWSATVTALTYAVVAVERAVEELLACLLIVGDLAPVGYAHRRLTHLPDLTTAAGHSLARHGRSP